jgi:carboxypeptidase C (cathepsin A)
MEALGAVLSKASSRRTVDTAGSRGLQPCPSILIPGSTLRTCFGENPKLLISVHSSTDLYFRVEQPVGTGYTVGRPTATTEEEIAADFVGFLRNFQTTFGIKNFKIYVTGESYAGRYIPYISAAILNQNDKESFDLHGKSSWS